MERYRTRPELAEKMRRYLWDKQIAYHTTYGHMDPRFPPRSADTAAEARWHVSLYTDADISFLQKLDMLYKPPRESFVALFDEARRARAQGDEKAEEHLEDLRHACEDPWMLVLPPRHDAMLRSDWPGRHVCALCGNEFISYVPDTRIVSYVTVYDKVAGENLVQCYQRRLLELQNAATIDEVRSLFVTERRRKLMAVYENAVLPPFDADKITC